MLENKLGINNSTDLAREEERISKIKAMRIFEENMLDNLEPGKFSTLQTIHRILFEDIYLPERLETLIWQKEISDLHHLCIWK